MHNWVKKSLDKIIKFVRNSLQLESKVFIYIYIYIDDEEPQRTCRASKVFFYIGNKVKTWM